MGVVRYGDRVDSWAYPHSRGQYTHWFSLPDSKKVGYAPIVGIGYLSYILHVLFEKQIQFIVW